MEKPKQKNPWASYLAHLRWDKIPKKDRVPIMRKVLQARLNKAKNARKEKSK